MTLSPPPKSVLIINIFGIGDVLFTTALLKNIKSAFPNVSISYLANQRTAGMLNNNPYVDSVMVYERDDFLNTWNQSKKAYFRKWWELYRSIKSRHFDVAIDLSLTSFPGLLCWLAGVRCRVGYNYKKRSPFLNNQVCFTGFKDKHVIEYYLDILKILQIPVIYRDMTIASDEESEIWADRFLKNLQRNEKEILIGLVPGGGASWGGDSRFKRWKPELYAKLADKLIENHRAKIILFGDQSEVELCSSVMKQMQNPTVSVCGQTNIQQFVALARRCQLMVLNDGGPLHISVAAGVVTVSIFGPVDERVYGPYPSGQHRVVKKGLACQPCYRNFRRADCQHVACLEDLTLDEVYDAVKSILNQI